MAEIEFGDVVLGRFGAKKHPFCVSVIARWNTKRGTRMDASPYLYTHARTRMVIWLRSLSGYQAVPSMRRYDLYLH